MIKEQRKGIVNAINVIDADCLIGLNNEADCDNFIFENTEENIKQFIPNSFDALLKAFHGDYNPNDNYARLNGQANLESSNDITEWVDMDVIAEHLISEEWTDDEDYCDNVIDFCAYYIEDNYDHEHICIDIQEWLNDNYTTNEIVYGEWDDILNDFNEYVQKNSSNQ